MMRYINDSMDGKNILVTGGAGFIGSNLAKYFNTNHPNANIFIFDKFRKDGTLAIKDPAQSLGSYQNLLGFRGDVISGDINSKKDLKRLSEYNKFDIIFHEAAISNTTCFDEELIVRTNTNAFKDILDMAKDMSAKIIYASSAGTYGNTPAPNIVGKNEHPANAYGFSKIMMDNIAYRYIKEFGMHIVGLRYFNVYGPGEYFKDKTASMVLQLSKQILAGANPKIFKDGDQKRDFVYIEDVVQANVKAIESKQSGVYNVGYGEARTFNDLANLVIKNVDSSKNIEYINNPYKFFQKHTEADIDSTKRDLGYVPAYSLERGIEEYTKVIKTYEY